MIANEQMFSNRFGRWAGYRKLHRQITGHLQAGGAVQVTTYTRSTIYTAKHATWFTCDKTGVFVQAGKKHVCITYCGIRFSK